MSAIALVVAAGRGSRAGGPLPKQYQDIGGRPVLAHALAAFTGHPSVTAVRAVIHPSDRALYDAAAAGLDVLAAVAGGASRQESVLRGLESLSDDAPDAVLIHDAARPFVSAATISASLDALAEYVGAVAAIPVTDTLKRGDGSRVAATVDRRGLWRAQTPQTFRFAEILAAHRAAAGSDLTDDAAVAERAGHAVALVPGDEDNVKITSEDDLARARRRFDGADVDVRVGGGFDVHRFGPGASVTLCGVEIPFTHSLVGHSDADAGLHALADALLSTVGAGDIGVHFPPADARWKGADSSLFLSFAAEQARARGGEITHLGVTLILTAPKIGPVRDRMVARIAGIAGIDAERVSVQATTTEGLGFTGRGEGVAAQATATVRLRR